jgi:hypothetical protein
MVRVDRIEQGSRLRLPVTPAAAIRKGSQRRARLVLASETDERQGAVVTGLEAEACRTAIDTSRVRSDDSPRKRATAPGSVRNVS